MGRAIDLFVTYRFIKLLVTPFEKTEAFKLGIIDETGNRVMPPPVAGYVGTASPQLEDLPGDLFPGFDGNFAAASPEEEEEELEEVVQEEQ